MILGNHLKAAIKALISAANAGEATTWEFLLGLLKTLFQEFTFTMKYLHKSMNLKYLKLVFLSLVAVVWSVRSPGCFLWPTRNGYGVKKLLRFLRRKRGKNACGWWESLNAEPCKNKLDYLLNDLDRWFENRCGEKSSKETLDGWHVNIPVALNDGPTVFIYNFVFGCMEKRGKQNRKKKTLYKAKEFPNRSTTLRALCDGDVMVMVISCRGADSLS